MRFTLNRRVSPWLAVPSHLFGATLLVGGIAAWRNPLMRPPRLPDKRPPNWALPTVGATWIGATLVAEFGRGTAARAARVLLSLPGWALIGFEAARGVIALRATGTADIVLVLGCALIGDEPSDMLERRLRRAVAVVKRKRGMPAAEGGAASFPTTIVCCGGVGADSEDGETPPSEAEVMARWLREHGNWGIDGVPELVEEGDSASTVENISNAIEILGTVPPHARVTVVTSDFHVLRVGQTIRHHSFDTRLGTGNWQVEGAWTPMKFWATSTLREFLAQPIVWFVSARRELLRLKNGS